MLGFVESVLKFPSSVLTKFCTVFPAGITLCKCTRQLFVFPRFYTEFLPLKKEPHVQRVPVFFLPVQPTGREADHSHSNSTEIKLNSDISSLPVCDRMAH